MKPSSTPAAAKSGHSATRQQASSTRPSKTTKPPPSPPQQPPEVKETPSAARRPLDEKLALLRQRLEKSFRAEFVGSFCYLVSVESQPRAAIEASLGQLDWRRLEYSLNQLKKICKNKNHLKYLLEKSLIERATYDGETAPTSAAAEDQPAKGAATSSTKASSGGGSSSSKSSSNLAKALDEEPQDEEYFVITTVVIRLLLKLYHFKATATMPNSAENNLRLFDLKLLLLSSLADLCYYEDLRAQVIEDKNLKDLFEVFANSIWNDIDASIKRKTQAVKTTQAGGLTTPPERIAELAQEHARMVEQFKKLWSKMVRLSSNLCQDKNCIKIKGLFNDDFLSSLSKLIEQCQQDWNGGTFKIDSNDLDFYHSILRLVKYGCDLADCKQSIIQNRLLVYLSRFLFKYNKIDDSKTEAQTSPPADLKYAALSKEMIKQYLVMLDGWPQPVSAEFYNQIIEGNAIEHLLRMQLNESGARTITSLSVDATKPAKASGSASSSHGAATEFNYSQFSFNLLYKFCRDYHACCSEFGRVGAIQKYIARIDQMSSGDDEFEKFVDMICMSCKESANRIRLREQGHLVFLVRLQQRLRTEAATAAGTKKDGSATDSLIHNKLLSALCCFAHDQDSMNILFANGLVDSLLAYLNESLDANTIVKSNEALTARRPDLDDRSTKKVKLSQILLIESAAESNSEGAAGKAKKTATTMTRSESRKRKTSDSGLTCPCKHSASSRPKRAKVSGSINELSPNATLVNTSSALFDATLLNVQTSPTGSCCSLSPPMSMQSPALSLSPTGGGGGGGARCSSAVSMLYYQTSNAPSFTPAFSNSSFSPSSNGLPSPNFYWSTSNPGEDASMVASSSCQQIQFSPSIKNETSDEEDFEEEEEDDDGAENNDEPAEMEEACASAGLKFDLDTSSSNLALSPPPLMGSPSSVTSAASGTKKSTALNAAAGLAGNFNYRSQNIESINRTEACVFYVLSQLSHGEKPSAYLFAHFEAILVCLLNYLRNARVRNPRALRILNRLTKNQTCFQNFVLSHLPYKIKSVFFFRAKSRPGPGDADGAKFATINRTFSNSSASSGSYPHLNRLVGNDGSDSNVISSKQEELIEKEMHLYLSSNKVFFDEHMFFPSFESIDFTLCNNLKSHCISSSDHGYFCLTSMMKYPQRPADRLSCALVAPFILRNSRALQNIMIQLNGLDLIIDLLTGPASASSSSDTVAAVAAADEPQILRSKAILCLKRILVFVNYKRDLKQINDHLESMKQLFFDSFKLGLGLKSRGPKSPAASSPVVKLYFSSELDGELLDSSKYLLVKRDELIEKSEYFNALLNGHFLEGAVGGDGGVVQCIELKEVSFETFSIILDLLNCRHVPEESVEMAEPSDEASSKNRTGLDAQFALYLNSAVAYELSIEQCFNVIAACDRFFLIDLKDLFISILICKFISIGSWVDCFQLAWQLNSPMLANSLIDFLLAKFLVTMWSPQEEPKSVDEAAEPRSSSPESELASSEDSREASQTLTPTEQDLEHLELTKCLSFVDGIVEGLSSRSTVNEPINAGLAPDQYPIVLFRKSLKYALCEIIRCNSWKFAAFPN